MKARIKSVKKLDDVTELTFSGDLPFAETFYTDEEYKVFRDKVLNLIKIEKLRYLIGLEFDWALLNGKPYPTKLILPENPIWVDFREPESISEALLPLSVRTGLEYGDYQFTGYGNTKICIERKEAEDLVGSILNGHLAEQIQKMQGDVKILLIEDFLTCTSQMKVRTKYKVRNVSWNAIWNYLQTAQREAGILLDLSPNTHATPIRIKSLYHYYQQPEHKSIRGAMLPSPSIQTPVRMLMCVEGYAQATVNKVLNKFGTLRSYFNATVKERQNVPDVGPIKAQVVDKALDEPLEEED